MNRCEPSIGSRAGVGVDDKFGIWVDALGRPRDERPDIGAIEYRPASDGGGDSGQPDAGHDAGTADAGDGGVYIAPPVLVAARVATPPVMDGDLREFEGAEIAKATIDGLGGVQVGVLWDDHALYLGVRVSDSKLYAVLDRRDGPLWNDDSIELLFDTLDNREPGELPGSDDYKFFVTPTNLQRDDRGGGAWETWNATWQSSVRLAGTLNDDSDVDQGYSAEIRLPWSDWGISKPTQGTQIGFDVHLNAVTATNIERVTWANTTRGTVNDPAGFGTLRFDGPAITPTDGGAATPPPQSPVPQCGCGGYGGETLWGIVACTAALRGAISWGRLRKSRKRAPAHGRGV